MGHIGSTSGALNWIRCEHVLLDWPNANCGATIITETRLDEWLVVLMSCSSNDFLMGMFISIVGVREATAMP